jgi:PPM family protein phosphatase
MDHGIPPISGAEMANAATLKFVKPRTPIVAYADSAEPPTPQLFAMLSNRGRVRQANEDDCGALPEHNAFVVCDGMGGAAAGEVASHLASETFLNSLSHSAVAESRARRPSKPTSSPEAANQDEVSPLPADHPSTRLHEAVRAANHAVFHRAQKSRSLRGMGTTLVAALLDETPPGETGDITGPTLWIAHVGDSRCYRFRSQALELLTEDHSLVEEQVRAGLLSRDQACCSPIRNIITRAIGSQPNVAPDISCHAIQSGDLYLLASDGLTRELDDSEIARILVQTTGRRLEPVCEALVDAANKKGGRDNITVLLVSCS